MRPRQPAALLKELRGHFTLNGKIVPPEVFRDLGDGDLADSGPIWLSIDALAAIGSNVYADTIKTDGAWRIQTKPADRPGELTQESAYRFIGTTANKLLIVVTRFNSGGTGSFYSLHIIDAAAPKGFDAEGKIYDRIVLTDIRAVPLGDRWDGEVKISGDAVAVSTTRLAPGAGAAQPNRRIIPAQRP